MVLLLLGVCTLPLLRLYWSQRSSNPVRRGWAITQVQACFVCHGSNGSQGIDDPGLKQAIPGWTATHGSEVPRTQKELRDYILFGHPKGESPARGAALPMPGYEDRLSASEVNDVMATVRVLAGWATPDSPSAAARGSELANRWDCFSCHGPAGAGGVANPGSFTGRIPGWYGAEFEHLVRDRDEFEQWVRGGQISRLADAPLARYFQRRQTLKMPPYRQLSDVDVDDLWAYTRWLDSSDGGATLTSPR